MQSISEWLESLGLDQYAQVFADNDIDLELIPSLSDQDLEKLGVSSMGHRKKLLKAIAELDDATTVAAPSPPAAALSAVPSVAPKIAPKSSDVHAERRQITVMFCDMVGSTALSEQLDPEDLRTLMQGYQQACGTVIARYEGHVAQYLGDGLMTYFGWPLAHEDDAERAVRAALEIIEAVKQVEAPVPLRVRIGMATGAVVVGETGAGDASVPKLAVGETPNLAARVQGLAEADRIVIADSTRRLLGSTFELSDLGAHTLKGIAEPVHTWAVTGVAAAEGRFDAHAEKLTPLVGRDEELSLVMRRWEQTREGEGHVVLLSGEPGIGKSRLIQALYERVADQPHIRLRYHCSPYHINTVLYPVIEQLERAAGFGRTDSTADKLDKLEALLGQGAADVAAVAPLFAALLSLDARERYPALTMSPQRQKEETLHALAEQVVGIASRQPLLMLFEDAQWIDPSTQEVLDLIVPMIASRRVLLVVTYRPSYQSSWSSQGHVLSVTLTRLGRAQATALVDKVTGGARMPNQVLDQIVAKADGVPLFVEELTKTVIESGLVARGAEGFELTGELSSLAIPSTLQDSLMARLDRLPVAVKELAQVCACIGREFTHALISAVAPLRDNVLDGALEKLVDSEVIIRKGKPPQATYTFRHALILEAAYNSLLRARRQSLHGVIAQALETDFPAIASAQPQILAQHYALAGMADKAIAYWLEAGKRAARVSANAEAYANLNAGLALLAALPEGADRDVRELDLNLAIINPLIAIKGYSAPDTKAVSERALALCRQTGQVSRIFPALSAQWVYHYVSGDIALCKKLAVDYLDLANTEQDRVPRLVGYRLMGISSLIGGSPAAAMKHFELAWDLFDPSLDADTAYSYGQDFAVSLRNYLSWAAILCGYPDRANRWAQEALSRARTIDHGNTLAFSLHLTAYTAFLLSDRQSFGRDAGDLQTLCDKLGLPVFQALGMAFQGAILGWQGRPQDGLEKVEDGFKKAGSIDFKIYKPIFLLIQAELFRELGRVEDALATIDEGLIFTSTTQEHWGDAELHRVRGELYASLSRESEAEDEYTAALAIAHEQQAKWWELRAAVSLARLWRGQNKVAEARELLAPVYDWFTEGFDTDDLKEAKALLDELA